MQGIRVEEFRSHREGGGGAKEHGSNRSEIKVQRHMCTCVNIIL